LAVKKWAKFFFEGKENQKKSKQKKKKKKKPKPLTFLTSTPHDGFMAFKVKVRWIVVLAPSEPVSSKKERRRKVTFTVLGGGGKNIGKEWIQSFTCD